MSDSVVKNPKIFIANFLFCGAGGWLCFLLQQYLAVPSFLASASVGFLGSFLPSTNHYDQKQAIAGVYTGSFAFMGSLTLTNTPLKIFTLCFLVAIFFTLISPYFRGVGGKLGSIAFLASLTFIFLEQWL